MVSAAAEMGPGNLSSLPSLPSPTLSPLRAVEPDPTGEARTDAGAVGTEDQVKSEEQGKKVDVNQ